MQYASVQSKEYADAMLKAGTPEKIDQDPIGTGPFYLVQYQKDAIIRYKAFPEYWAGKAKIDDLIFAITPDASVRWAKLQKGECHVMPYPNPADLEAMKKDANVQILEQPGLNIGYLAYNTTKKPFDRRQGPPRRQHGDQQEGDHRRGLSVERHRRDQPDPALDVVL
jgi:dipeptide transport system substrate-binding protein